MMEKIKFSTKQHINTIKKFESKIWNIIILLLMTFSAFSFQSFLEAKLNPDIVKANISNAREIAKEAFKLSSNFKITPIHSEKGGYYIAPGEKNIPIFAFSIESKKKTLLFKKLQLTLNGNVDNKTLIGAKLYEGTNKIASVKIKNNIFYFKNFTSVLKPNIKKIYTVKLDISEDIMPGLRFNFEIQNPYALDLKLGNNPQYSLDKYPIKGDYITVVGWRK